jgi:predicted MFS family arabinose efflux permease
VISEHASRHGVLGALRSPGVRTLVLTTLPMGFCFGAMEVMLPAFCEEHGSRDLAGALLAAWAGGSAAGGLLYGARAWTGPAGERYARLAMLLPLGYLSLAAAPSIAAMAPLVLVAGLCIAPTLTAGNQIAGAVAPDGAETEAYTWPITALVVGVAIGNVTAGAVVAASGWRAAAFAAAGGALATAVLAVLRRHTLQAETIAVPSGYEAAR